MFKSILALIPSERPVRPVVDGSVVLAMACHAHVNALAIGYKSTNIPIAAISSPATAMIFQENRLRAIERGETAMSVFELKNEKRLEFPTTAARSAQFRPKQSRSPVELRDFMS